MHVVKQQFDQCSSVIETAVALHLIPIGTTPDYSGNLQVTVGPTTCQMSKYRSSPCDHCTRIYRSGAVTCAYPGMAEPPRRRRRRLRYNADVEPDGEPNDAVEDTGISTSICCANPRHSQKSSTIGVQQSLLVPTHDIHTFRARSVCNNRPTIMRVFGH